MRTRFAPSPTGYLHIGSLRTALFEYLAAKSLNGTFVLRIEDTDQKREVPGAIENLVEILKWIGIEFDEGPHAGGNYGPYIQSQRKKIYKKYADELLGRGEVYHCFCAPERLEKMRAERTAKKLPPRYDRTCRSLSKTEVEEKIKRGERYVIRQKMPLEGETTVRDLLRGDIVFKNEELEDHVLIKSDGMPTYQFANVIDDHTMEITHVFRGEEWISSFPKNILLYRSFGWTPPVFAHIPLILNKEGGKLSKRQGDVAVEDYKEKGYLPEALLNFCILLGWHPKEENEILSFEDMKAKFKIEDIRISPAVFDSEKLDYFNGYYIRQKSLDELVELCWPYLKENLKMTENRKKKTEFLREVVALEQERLKKLSEIGELTKFFFEDDLQYDQNLLVWKKLTVDDVKENLKKLLSILENISEKDWKKEILEKTIMEFLNVSGLKVGDYLWPMRVALTGQKASPGPFEVAEVLGKEESLKRIEKATD